MVDSSLFPRQNTNSPAYQQFMYTPFTAFTNAFGQKSAGSGTSDTATSSVSAFLWTLIPVALQAIAFFTIFLFLRSKLKRVYRPRTFLGTLHDEEKTTSLPDGRFNWFTPFKSIPDELVLNRQSLDGYLYLRFLKMLTFICFVGCCITFPVLFPVNATGDAGEKQFDLLSFSNIGSDQKNRYYAHVFIGWIFFSFVMFVITRETIYFINLRNAYLLSPFNAAKISSRTVLFTDVPTEYLKIEKLQQLFGAAFIRAWLSTDCSDLQDEVDNRDKAAMKLESAEIKLSQTAVKRKLKWEKKAAKGKMKGKKGPTHNVADEEEASLASNFQKKKDRPTHRLGKIPLIGKKVDTINWSRDELRTLIPKVETEQAKHRKGDGKLLPAVFVEFSTQQAAQAAYRKMTPRKAPRMNPRAISVAPQEVVWKNLKIKKTERMGRKLATRTFLTLMIIFWSIPVAVVGAISNINYLQEKVPFLHFISQIPPVILGVVTGLLPSVLLSVLMSLVPVVCRWMSKLSGEVTLPNVELTCQHWYMAFQVIQVFLVTTFASGAASTVSSIINQPSSATTLLAENLPKASNFYISYIIVQGLGIAAGNILNIGALVMLTFVGKFLDKSPRKMFKRYVTLAGLGWGTLYPQFGNMGIIAITYSIISPLVMGFATVGLGLVYLAVRYNSMYVLTNNIDTKGAAYACAMQQLMTGVYLSEVCLLGLFAINTAPGPIVLMAVFLGATAIYHAMMRNALRPLTQYLPERLEGDGPTSLFSMNDNHSYDALKAGVPPSETKPLPPGRFTTTKASLFSKIWDPRKFKSYNTVQALMPNTKPPQYEEEEEQFAYYNPAITSRTPRLWIVRDDMGISQQEVRDNSEIVNISDDYARFNGKGKVVWDIELLEQGGVERVPVWEKRVVY